MPIDVNKLRREKKLLKTEMHTLCQRGLESPEKRMSEQDGTRYIELEGKVKEYEDQVVLAERNNALELELAGNEPAPKGDDDSGAGEERSFGSFGEFLQSVRSFFTPGGTRDSRLDYEERGTASGQNENVPSDGGVLVKDQFLPGIMRKVFDQSLIANRCRKIPIGAGARGLTWNDLDESSRVAGSRFGGIRAYWTAEASTVTASQAKYVKREVKLEKLMSIIYATEEILEDATALESFTDSLVSEELAYKVDDAIFSGTGAGMPLGLLNSDCLIEVSKETGQAADTVVYENIVKMRSRLWARSRASSVWYINQDVEPELHTMAFVVGTGGVPVYLPATGVAGSPFDTLYGRPVIPVEHASTVGTAGDILLTDPSQYLLIDKGGIKKAVSIHVRFLYDEQAFRFTYRINGAPLWTSALTPANGTNTVSPAVALESRT